MTDSRVNQICYWCIFLLLSVGKYGIDNVGWPFWTPTPPTTTRAKIYNSLLSTLYNIYETLGLEMPAYNLIEKLQVNTDPLRPSLPPPHHPRGLTKRNRNTTLVKDLDIVLMKTFPCLTFCIILKGVSIFPRLQRWVMLSCHRQDKLQWLFSWTQIDEEDRTQNTNCIIRTMKAVHLQDEHFASN